MNTSNNNQNNRPKIDNNALFAQRLKDSPPEYNLGDKVNTQYGVAYISGRVYSERENKWKYAINPVGLKNFHMDEVIVYGKIKE